MKDWLKGVLARGIPLFSVPIFGRRRAKLKYYRYGETREDMHLAPWRRKRRRRK